jgi:stage II sporulation protein P
MNPNLPMSFESSAVPYIRPHQKEKKAPARRFLALGLVVLLLVGVVLTAHFLPEDMKNNVFGWLFGGDTSTETTTTDVTTTENGTTDCTTAPPAKTEDMYHWQCELPQGATAILPTDRSANTLGIFAENPTDALLEEIQPSFPKKGTGAISVIIVNTHSFESYAEENALYYTDTGFASNGAENVRVSAVAEALCAELNQNGVGAVFVDCMAQSSFGSYKNAQRLAELTLADHPEAVLVIDIHRAVLTDDTGALLRPITKIAENITAQARILLGTGANFEKNTATALAFYEMLNLRYESLMMPLSVSENALLQKLSVPVLTLEVGSAGNAVSEAKQTAVSLAKVLAELLL